MPYATKEMFYSLQGEGAQAGRAAVFCRFTGCNLWSGRDSDREKAICKFCDTDFVGADAGSFTDPNDLAAAAMSLWSHAEGGRPLVICTGGEPLLQLDEKLCAAFHAVGFEIAVETNGTQPRCPGIDWLCVSPKANAPLQVAEGDELKLVFPQPGVDPQRFVGLAFKHFFLQPMDGDDVAANTVAATEYCLKHPQWRLGLQLHKILGLR
ncbi:7-carboxy-7-deazaguanine synthase [Magnetospirillum aberrantis]|uniref:7-carboxy-7-deazaguanine synthase n=1 Tax=Magnetospirillum aberrantis SpK TaxID=908842 RepID=A0A7C9QV99_9PROT|nr:7-carboxy-7-deazaguanine synthase [Magnetospirillum aberrantis]NFV80999.1 7-carboxy-7-deazaguanine synthase [Magnetospirillum aberrantis SpK]